MQSLSGKGLLNFLVRFTISVCGFCDSGQRKNFYYHGKITEKIGGCNSIALIL